MVENINRVNEIFASLKLETDSLLEAYEKIKSHYEEIEKKRVKLEKDQSSFEKK